jgi:hypothetical protein
LFAALIGAVDDAKVPPPSEVPHGPSFFQFGEDDVFRALLLGAGFADVEIGSFALDFPLHSGDELLKIIGEGTVRMAALLRTADEAQRAKMRASLERRLEPWRSGDGYAVPALVKIAAGTKPGR